MRGSSAGPPASTRATPRSASSLSRPARTAPPVPEPMTMKSNQFSGDAETIRETLALKSSRLFPVFALPSIIRSRSSRATSSRATSNRGGRRIMGENSVREPVITLSAGPVAAYPQVLLGMARPVHYDFDPYFQEFYEQVVSKLNRALKTREPTLLLHCEPAVGLEAAAASLIGPEDVVLNLASGVYGKGFGYWSARYHKEMVEIEVPYNEAIDPASVADAFRKRPDIRIVSVVHHDTPSGTPNPVAEIGKLVPAHDALPLVDAGSSFGLTDV